MALHPALQQIADAITQSGAPRLDQMSLADARAFGPGWAAELGGKGPDVERIEDVTIAVRHGNIAGKLYVPSGQLRALIVYFHGGGWVLGDVPSYDPVARVVATETKCAVLMVEYRLAPEFPFPAGLEDCCDATAWASVNIEPPLPLVVMGDSGGGNLAAVVAQRARQAGPSIDAQILVVPNLDAACDTASYKEIWESPLFGGQSMEWFLNFYQPNRDARLIPDISPIRAESLAGLPPSIVVTTEHDPLRDEGDTYASALRAAGVRVVHYHLETISHGFLSMPGVFDVPKRTMRQVGNDLESLLAGGSPEDRTFATLPPADG